MKSFFMNYLKLPYIIYGLVDQQYEFTNKKFSSK